MSVNHAEIELLAQRNNELRARIELEEKLAALEVIKTNELQRRHTVQTGITNELSAQLQIEREISRLQEERLATKASSADQSFSQTNQHANDPSLNEYLVVWLTQSMQGPDRLRFKGDPLEYPEFLVEYEQTVSRLTNYPSLCLRILKSMLADQALKIVRHHFLDEDPSRGLKEALATLEMAFGTKTKQCRAHLSNLLSRPDVLPTEAGLMEFFSELDCYQSVMRRCKRLQELDSNQTLEALFAKLPIEIRRKWEKEVFKSPDQEPTYELLMRAVREVHRQKTSEVGQWEEALLAAQARDSAGCEDEGNTCSVSSDEASPLPNSKHASDEFQFKLPPPPDEKPCPCGTERNQHNLSPRLPILRTRLRPDSISTMAFCEK